MIIIIIFLTKFGIRQSKLQKAIAQNIKNGFSKKEVEKALISAGWNKEKVQAELKK